MEPVLGPDYSPADPRPSSPLTVGLTRNVTFSLRVANVGNGSANRTASLAFFNVSTPGTPFATFPVPALAAGTTSSPFLVVWRSPAIPGTYAIVGDVDHGDDIAEWNETNNTHTLTVTVVPGPVTSLGIGHPNFTASVPYVTSVTPLSLSALDQSGTGIRSTRYQIDTTGWIDYASPFSLSLEGEHVVEWFSEDNAGNVEAMRSAVLRVDDTPPATSLMIADPKYIVGGTFVTSATPLSLSADDGGVAPVGVARTEYQVDGGGWLPYASPFTLSGDGPHLVEARAWDLLGNVGTAAMSLIVDDTASSVSLAVGDPRFQGAALYVTSATPISLDASDPGSDPVGLASVEYRVGGGAWAPYSSAFTLAGPDGPQRVEYAATDRLGNRNEAAAYLVVDDTPPATEIAPRVGPHTPDTVFALMPTDAGSGVARTEYRVDGGPWLPYAGGFSLPVGSHTIRYRSVDNVGNAEAERALSVTIAGEPPPFPPEANWKPLVAAVFAILLAIAGIWSSRKRPWESGTGRKAVLRAFAVTALPFVLAETSTGVVSLTTGLLSIPPLLGAGTVVDGGLLALGVAASLLRVHRGHALK